MKTGFSFRSWLVALPLALWPQLASADQCQWIEESTAKAALKIIEKHPNLRLYCAPCGDQAAVAVQVVRAEVKQATMGGKPQPFKVVWVTDSSGKLTDLDLAYTYVELDPPYEVYTNLAKLTSCPASDVPETIGPSGAPPKHSVPPKPIPTPRPPTLIRPPT